MDAAPLTAAEQLEQLHTAWQQERARAQQAEARAVLQEQQLQQLRQTHAQSSPSPTLVVHHDSEQEPHSAFPFRSNEPKPPRPETYDGTRFSSGKSNVTTWLAEMQQYLVATNLAEHKWVAHAATYLRGTALLAWQGYLKVQSSPVSAWSQFYQWFLARFQPIAAAKTARTALRMLCQKPGHSVSSYNDEFLRQMQMISDMAEADQVEYYKQGLHSIRVADWVDRRDPKTLMEAMEYAQLEDLRVKRFKHSQNFTHSGQSFPSYSSSTPAVQVSVPMDLSHMHGDNVDAEYDMYADEQSEASQQLSFMSRRPAPRPFSLPSGTATGTAPTTTIGKLTPAERQRCMKEHLCFRCRQKGHGASSCPTFPNNRSGKGQAQ